MKHGKGSDYRGHAAILMSPVLEPSRTGNMGQPLAEGHPNLGEHTPWKVPCDRVRQQLQSLCSGECLASGLNSSFARFLTGREMSLSARLLPDGQWPACITGVRAGGQGLLRLGVAWAGMRCEVCWPGEGSAGGRLQQEGYGGFWTFTVLGARRPFVEAQRR